VPNDWRSTLDAGVDLGERLGASIDSALTRHPWVSPGALSLAFLAGAMTKARQCPLWNDEVLTRYVASLPGIGAIWQALADHAESSPPLFHLATRLSAAPLGWTELGLRLPSIAGYLTMMLCCYFIVKRYTGPLYASIAALAAYLTAAPAYAVQARPYGPLLGLSCLALVCWRMAARYRLRALALAGLALTLAATLGMHYYAFLSFGALGFGEIVRTWRQRRVDWPVWVAFALAAVPAVFLLPLVRSNLALRSGFFSPATLSNFLGETTTLYLYLGGVPWLLFALGAGACAAVFGQRQAQPAADQSEGPPIHEVAAWLVLLLAPVEAFIAGKLVTGVFVSRYAIVTIIGFSTLLPLGLARLFRGSRAAALVSLLILIPCFGGRYAVKCRTEDPRSSLVPGLESAASRLPVVVVNPLTYLPLAYYAGPELGDRIVYMADPKQALRYTGNNSADYSLAGLRGRAPLNLPGYAEFTGSHRQFLVLWESTPLGWITPKLLDAGAELRVCRIMGARVLFLASFSQKTQPAGDQGPASATDAACRENGLPDRSDLPHPPDGPAGPAGPAGNGR
jgi:hypothetical protein